MPEIAAAAWLTKRCLLLVGDLAGENREPGIWLLDEGGSTQLAARYFRARRPDGVGEAEVIDGFIAVVPEAALEAGGEVALGIRIDDETLPLGAPDLSDRTTDLRTLVRQALAPLDAQTRTDVLEIFASMSNAVPRDERPELSERLFEVREALRERLPPFVTSPSKPCGAHIDQLLAIDERSFQIDGWMHHEGLEFVRLSVVSPEGSRAEIVERIFRYPRPDVAEFFSWRDERLQEALGFVCFFELDAPSFRADGWVVEFEREDGVALELAAPTVLSDPLETRDAILHGPYVGKTPSEELMSNHLFPAVSRLQGRLRRSARVDSSFQLGAAPSSPEVSIVVPLTQAFGPLEVQLSQFADDPELFEADLVYVLDSPEGVDALGHAADIFPIYRVPFRLAVPDQKLSPIAAVNAGAELARGRLLLLMEPDVLPREPGWIGQMRDFYDAGERIGALGPKLLYEDDSIQNAGLYFYQRAGSSLWARANHFKGMHRLLPGANVARSVAALSKACLMIDTALYEERGGLPGIYIGGGYADSDLCLELSKHGLESWYLPDVELYHLEEPPLSRNERLAAERYDMRLHSHRRGEQIAGLMQGRDLAGVLAQG